MERRPSCPRPTASGEARVCLRYQPKSCVFCDIAEFVGDPAHVEIGNVVKASSAHHDCAEAGRFASLKIFTARLPCVLITLTETFSGANPAAVRRSTALSKTRFIAASCSSVILPAISSSSCFPSLVGGSLTIWARQTSESGGVEHLAGEVDRP